MNIIFFTILGTCLGSFIPCYAERRQINASHFDRSRCMTCNNNIPYIYLIPILGYFLSRKRCVYCHTPIPKYFPVLEALGGASGFFISYFSSSFYHSCIQLLIISTLLLLSLDDYNTHWIHDEDLIFLAFIEVTDILLVSSSPWIDHIIGAFIISVPLLAIYYIRPNTLGSGDIIYMMINGFYMGFVNISYSFLAGVLIALCFSIKLIIQNKATYKTSIPLIPFLSTGIYLIMLLSLLFPKTLSV